jgi:uncharacterized protein YqiB (DUF1249 family)
VSHTISEIRRRSPMWVYEKNYQLLVHLLPFLRNGRAIKQVIRAGADHLQVVVLEKSKYTHLVELQQLPVEPDTLPTALTLQVRLYHDAQLAEVSTYQDHHRLLSKYDYPNRNMFHRDEKRQANCLLYDWLCMLTPARFDLDDEQVVTEV